MKWALLEGIPEDEASEILSGFRRRTFARGEVVFHEGDPADTLHLIARGHFAVGTTTPVGEVATFTVVGPGNFFGELALLSRVPVRTATVSALVEAETRSIHKRDLVVLRERYPSVTEALVEALIEEVDRLSHRLAEALYVPADRRVLRRLHELAELYCGEEGEAVIPLTQEELAGLAGTSRATVNRVLREQERRGAVRLRRGETVVTDLAALPG